jgi:hypothetical protein
MTDAMPAEQLDAAADGAFSGKLADPADTLTKRGGKGHVVYEGTAYDRMAWTRRCAERGYTLAAGEGALLLAALIEAEHNISALAAELATLTRERDALRENWSGLLIEQANLLRLREEAIQQRDEAVQRRREIDDEAFDYAEQVEELRAQRDDARRDAAEVRELLAIAFREGWNCGDWRDGHDNVTAREYDWTRSAVKAKADAARIATTPTEATP